MPPKRKATEPDTPPTAHPPIFEGCRMVFWAGPSSKILQQRVAERGGVVQPALVASGQEATTHVLCASKPPLSGKQAASKLQGFAGPAHEVRVQDGTLLRMPSNVTFVLTDWAAHSIGKGRLQPTDAYLPPCLRPAPEAPAAAAIASDMPPEQPSGAGGPAGGAVEPGAAAPAEAAAAAAARPAALAEGPASSVVTQPLDEQQLEAALQDVMQPALASQQEQEAESREAAGQRPTVRCRVVRRGAEFVAVEGCKPHFTGGDTGIPWGSFGVWDEPYDLQAARHDCWLCSAKPAVPTAGSHPGPPSLAQAATQPSAQAASPPRNAVCGHVCCALREQCIVAELRKVGQAYQTGGRTDQFKQKALSRTINRLIGWNKPLDTAEDVREMGLTERSLVKVLEVVEFGRCSRADGVVASESLTVHALFQQVWGVGQKTAERWFSLGLRSLDDVRQRAEELHLTEQQRIGLKYFDDLAHRVPRAEVAQAEAIVREACFELVEQHGGRNDVEFTFCWATGSYRRGAPDSSDIDILICLPPSLAGASCGVIMSELLRSLLRRDLLLDELVPGAPPHEFQHAGMGHASWMGLLRVVRPGGRVRRIDIKIYPAEPACAAFAVNYFANSQAFCRATRYWATYAETAAQHARQASPSATGYKLSDTELLPITKPPRKRDSGAAKPAARSSDSEIEASPKAPALGSPPKRHRWPHADVTPVGPPVPCADETALFRALGLSYVPTHMRVFPEFT
ncbi:hypothetical protein ABPG77_011017 [Micractinium sp. CCAP 211/92]